MTRAERCADWARGRHVSAYPESAFSSPVFSIFSTRGHTKRNFSRFLTALMRNICNLRKFGQVFALSPLFVKKEESEIAPLLGKLYSEKYATYPSKPILSLTDLDEFLRKSIGENLFDNASPRRSV